jgi:hypothetical protein
MEDPKKIHEHGVCETETEICSTLNDKTKSGVYYCGATGSCGQNATYFEGCPYPRKRVMVKK